MRGMGSKADGGGGDGAIRAGRLSLGHRIDCEASYGHRRGAINSSSKRRNEENRKAQTCENQVDGEPVDTEEFNWYA